MIDRYWPPPIPPEDLLADPSVRTRAQEVGVYLGLGDLVQVRYTPAYIDDGGYSQPIPGEASRWDERLHVVFNRSGAHNPRSINAGDVRLRQRIDAPEERVRCIEMSGTVTPDALRVLGTLTVDEVRPLIAARWQRRPGSRQLDVAALLCPDGTVREPLRYHIAADLSLIDNLGLYQKP